MFDNNIELVRDNYKYLIEKLLLEESNNSIRHNKKTK